PQPQPIINVSARVRDVLRVCEGPPRMSVYGVRRERAALSNGCIFNFWPIYSDMNDGFSPGGSNVWRMWTKSRSSDVRAFGLVRRRQQHRSATSARLCGVTGSG